MTTFLLPFGSWIYIIQKRIFLFVEGKPSPSVFRLSNMRGNPPGSTTESTQPVPLLSYERSDRVDAVTFQTEAMRCERLMYPCGYSILHNDQDCADAVQEALTRAWQKQPHPAKSIPFPPMADENSGQHLPRHLAPASEDPLRAAGRSRCYPPSRLRSPCRSGNASISSGPNGASPCFCTIWKDSPSLRLPIRWACRRGTVKTRLMKARARLSVLLREDWEEGEQ